MRNASSTASSNLGSTCGRDSRDGTAERVIAWKRKEVSARQKMFGRLLGHLPTDSDPTSSHVWLPLPAPWRCQDFVALSRMRGVAVTPPEVFVVGRASAPHAVRICLATPPEREQAQRGLRILAEIVDAGPQACHSIV